MFLSAKTAERRDVIVGDVKLSKRSGQRVAIVLRVGARSRYGSDVGDERDLRLLQQVHEFREGPRRVADSEDGESHTPLCRSRDYIQANRLRKHRPPDLGTRELQVGLKPGQPLEIRAGDGCLEIEVVPTPVQLKKRGKGVVAIPDAKLPALTVEPVRETLRRVRR